MDFLSLKYFIAVAEHGSFSKAADHLYTTQPNVSRHIQRLEKELKVQLFNRTGKNVEMTYPGSKCLIEIKDIVEKVKALKNNAVGYSCGELGDLRIGYTGEFNYSKFSEIVGTFGNEHKNINILFSRKSQSEVLDALFKDELDIVLTLATGLNEIDNICYYEIMKNSLIIISPENHPFAEYDFVTNTDLREEPIIMFHRHTSPYVFDMLMKYLQDNNLYNNIVSYENDLQSMLLKVESGKGITFLTALSLRSSASKIHLLDFDYDRKETNVNLALVWKKENRNPSLSLFLAENSMHYLKQER